MNIFCFFIILLKKYVNLLKYNLQTHLFEDRVMKMSYIDIGKECSIGGMSVILYDSKMEDGSILDNLSVLMKGETISKMVYLLAYRQNRFSN